MGRLKIYQLTKAQDEELRRMVDEGCYDRVIAQRLGVPVSAICYRRRQLGLRKRGAHGWSYVPEPTADSRDAFNAMKQAYDEFIAAADAFIERVKHGGD